MVRKTAFVNKVVRLHLIEREISKPRLVGSEGIGHEDI